MNIITTIYKFVNWGNLISVIIGAILSVCLTYFLTKKREEKRLRLDLQIKVTEQLLEAIKRFTDSSSKMINVYNLNYNTYNIMADWYQKSANTSPVYDNIIKNNLNQVEWCKDTIKKEMDEFRESWQRFCFDFLSVINILESKQVILNKFVGFNNLMLSEFDNLAEIEIKIVNFYFMEISQIIINNKIIDENLLVTFADYSNEFLKKRVDIGFIVYDLRIGLQNEFLSRLFKYKVPVRQPLDKSKSIYKPGFKYVEKD